MSTTINRLVYGDLVFTDHEIQEGEIYETAALLSDALEIGTLQVELYLRDESKGAALTGFHRNDTLFYYHRDKLRGTYYIEQVERTGKFTYSVTASDALGLLDQSSHMGGIYTGQTVGELVAEICNIPYQVQSRFAKIKLYGWLPVATRRSNLAQVLFAVGAQAKVDQYGALRIEALWDGVSSAITPDRIFWGDRVRYEARVTEVSVLEHQYIPGTEEVQLFEGTTQSGDVIQFQEPVHSLEASGFSLLEYGANYARVSAGTGILTGKKYDHTTRDVRQAVTPSDVANVVEVKEATLVSLVNSAAVAERLADYYKFIESMEATVVYDGERPGDVIAFEHPFGGASVGCVKSASITIGGKLVAQETTAIGYRPTKMEDLEYLDGLEVLTGDGEWIPPEGAENVRAVLIGGGGAGYNGSPGENVDYAYDFNSATGNYSPAQISRISTSANVFANSAGKGGAGGAGGVAGKVLEIDYEISGQEKIVYSCGKGGAAEGQPGSDTVFGAFSSASGDVLPSGYLDIISGTIYASPGAAGEDGGDGGSAGEAGSSVAGASGGAPLSGGQFSDSYHITHTIGVGETDGELSGYAAPGGGGGAGGNSGDVSGANGLDAAVHPDGAFEFSGKYENSTSATARGIVGGNGGNGAKGSDGKTFGSGGNGGGGGGGAGQSSGEIELTVKLSVYDYQGSGEMRAYASVRTTESAGGAGGGFGAGADGCVIVFYKIPKKILSGPVLDKNVRPLLDRMGRRMIV